MLVLLLIYTCVYLTIFIQETQTEFADLGELLFAGVLAAIVFAVGFTYVRLRLREKYPPSSKFISINQPPSETKK